MSADKRGQNRDGGDHNAGGNRAGGDRAFNDYNVPEHLLGVNVTSTEQANVRIDNSIDIHVVDSEINSPSIRLNEEEKDVGIQIPPKDDINQHEIFA